MSGRARRCSSLLAATVALLALLSCAGFARADSPSPWWRLSARPAPTYLPQSGEAKLIVAATNVGDAPTSGPITITDKLPANIQASAIIAHAELEATSSFCQGPPSSASEPSCTYEKAVAPYERLEIEITVKTSGAHTGEVNTLSVSGGGAPATPPLARPLRVSEEPVPFGIEKVELVPEEAAGEGVAGGAPDRRAGSIPFQLTTELDFNQKLEAYPGFVSLQGRGAVASAPALPRDLAFKLPPGLLGNVNSLAQCSDTEFATIFTGNFNGCPASSAIGVATVAVTEPNNIGTGTRRVPVFNMVPAPGEPAQFGFEVERVQVILKTEVLTGEDYAVAVRTTETSQLAQVLSAQVTLWGEPGSEAHDGSRGWSCLVPWRGSGNCVPPAPAERPSIPFLRLPTACEPMTMRTEGVSWPTSAAPNGLPLQQPEPLPGDSSFLDELIGCGSLPFSPSIEVTPEQQAGNTPSGMTVDVKVPQEPSLQLGGLAEGDVRSTTVTLPEGMLLNPAAADGLLACSEAQIGLHSVAPIACPNESKVGVVHIESPFLPKQREKPGEPFETIDGAVYLAAQEANPFGSLLALYIVAESPISHVLVKLAGEVKLNPSTGQIASTFKDTPPLPFEDLKLQFFGGPRASLTTPAGCGPHTTSASFSSWSGAEAPASATFQTTTGAEGGACSEPQPFAPSISAGSTNTQAGAFTPFTLTISRPDADQAINSLTVHLPPGIAAMLASVTPCPEPQAAGGQCGPESEIGHASSSAGLGSDPFTLQGTVYLTGPYGKAPFGLSIVTPANAGPFHLGNVIVRSAINVDPHTAAVTISSAVPTMVSTAEHPDTGIPVQLKQTTVTVDRPNFQFNPTNCSPMSITATMGGAQGALASVSSPFQVGNCGALPFHPTLTATTKGNASKANGASFTVKVTSSPGQANIAKTKLVLPIQLPARLTTIQKACTDAVFEANPAACPEGSNIGSATAHTPVLRSPLSGPAYLVSHGNAAFPDVEFVLQGEGITLILDGQTDIKKGITTSTFNSVPDAPVTSFETVLPEGPHSALTSNVPTSRRFSLCGSKLTMPTTITAQNGAVIERNTPIPVTGCGAVKGSKTTRAQLLAKALKKCRKQFKRAGRQRAACEKKARKRYAANKAGKGAAKHKKRS
ncbi:MAG: hypothetical protein ACHQHO_08530 [Solirubrobacterales bacterium]